MQYLVTVELLSKFLRKSVLSIRSDACRNPQSLPPICRLPGTKRLLWRMQDVETWIDQHVDTASAGKPATHSPSIGIVPKGKRGRPTKAEQIARQRNLAAVHGAKGERARTNRET